MSNKHNGSKGNNKKRLISKSIIFISQAINQLERVCKYLSSNDILNEEELDKLIENIKIIENSKNSIIEIYKSESFRKNMFKDTFNKFKIEWLNNTKKYSSSSEIVSDVNYNYIISMGKDVIPLIFEDLEKTNNHWFHALVILTGRNPVKEENIGYIEKMKDDWIMFGKENGYI